MREHYDFSDSKPNPYAKRMRQQITIQLDGTTVDYFKNMAEEKGIPYQNLIDLYLKDCVSSHRDLKLTWV